MFDRIRRGVKAARGPVTIAKTKRSTPGSQPPTPAPVALGLTSTALTDEAAERLGITDRHVIDLVKAGDLEGRLVRQKHPRYKNQRGGPSKYWVVSLTDLERLATSRAKSAVRKDSAITNGTLSYVSTMTAGVRLGVTRTQVARWASMGTLKAIKGPKPERGGYKPWLIERTSLDALIAKRKAEAEGQSQVTGAYKGKSSDPPHPTRPVDSIEKIMEDFLTFLAETSTRVQRLR